MSEPANIGHMVKAKLDYASPEAIDATIRRLRCWLRAFQAYGLVITLLFLATAVMLLLITDSWPGGISGWLEYWFTDRIGPTPH